ncbi:cell division protein FtsQ/DivIB [Aerococcus christensenii]|uniref:cell division protein FtsQ/DivIB n=1 Tax=Aerococcus christensenii TaxID=87541 RepID=UPI0023AA148C|nr:cell division protein FtsQ/DivIB [Aerococcus christensenii]WEB70506.1 cell division protein FtsQ/DivIB [Aerococcus christensenii]
MLDWNEEAKRSAKRRFEQEQMRRHQTEKEDSEKKDDAESSYKKAKTDPFSKANEENFSTEKQEGILDKCDQLLKKRNLHHLYRKKKESLQKKASLKDKEVPEKEYVSFIKKGFHWPSFGIGLCCVGIIAFSSWWLSPFNRVQGLTVSGNRLVADEQLLFTSGLKPNMSYLGIEKETPVVTERLRAQYPSVQKAQVIAEDNFSVRLNVQEFRAVGYIDKEDFKCPVLENQQTLTDPLPYGEQDVPNLVGFGEDEIPELASQLGKLSDDILAQIEEVDNVSDEIYQHHIAFKMKDGNIVVGFVESFAKRMQYYNQIVKSLKNQKGIINMEVGSFFEVKTPLTDPFASPEERERYIQRYGRPYRTRKDLEKEKSRGDENKDKVKKRSTSIQDKEWNEKQTEESTSVEKPKRRQPVQN